MARIPPRAGVRDNLSASEALRQAQLDERANLSAMESAFRSPIFKQALTNVMEDFYHKMAKSDDHREHSDSSYHLGGRSGRFVKKEPRSSRPAVKYGTPRTVVSHDPRRASIDFERYTVEELREELHRIGEEMNDLSITRKGLNYVLLPNLRREIDHLSKLEGSFQKGLLRKALTSNSITGGLSKLVYGRRDRIRAEEKEKASIDKQLGRLDKRLTLIGDAILDRATKEDAERAETNRVSEELLHGQDYNNRLFKKLLNVEQSSTGSLIPTLTPGGIKVGDAVSGVGSILNVAKLLFTSPIFLGLVGTAILGLLTYEFITTITKAFKEQKKRDQSEGAKEAGILASRPENAGMSNADLSKAGYVQQLAKQSGQKDTSPNAERAWKAARKRQNPALTAAQLDKEWMAYAINEAPGTIGHSMDQLGPLKRKFMQKRSEQLLFSSGGYNANSANQQAEKEWQDYTTNGGRVKNSPVASILDSDLRRETGLPRAVPQLSQTGKASATDVSTLIRKTGPDVDIDGLDPAVRDNLLAMASYYRQITGQPLPVNSAKRSRSKQEALYKADPNKAARPGSSMHEFGYAIDINTAASDQLDKSGILAKFGFVRTGKTKNGALETWHLEAAAIQGHKSDIIAAGGGDTKFSNAPEGAEVEKSPVSSTGSVAASSTASQPSTPSPIVTTGSSSPVQNDEYQPTPYATPGASAAKTAAALGSPDDSPPSPQSVSSPISAVGPQGLGTIPMFVDNLNLALFNTGSVR